MHPVFYFSIKSHEFRTMYFTDEQFDRYTEDYNSLSEETKADFSDFGEFIASIACIKDLSIF